MGRTIVAMGLAALAAGCSGGSVAPRVDPALVTGTRIDTWWQDDGTTILRPNVPAGLAISALVPEGGGYREISGTIGADGHFSIPGVPVGIYYLAVRVPGEVPRIFEQTARTTDLGAIKVGRPEPQVAAQPTSLSVALTDLEPWSLHDLTLVSTGARIFRLLPSDLLGEGGTAGTFRFGMQGLPLLTSGDLGWLVQTARRTSPGGVPYRVAVRQAALPAGTVLADGDAAVLGPMALSDGTSTGSVGLDLRLSEYLALAPAAAGVTAMPYRTGLAVRASPRIPAVFPSVVLVSMVTDLEFPDVDLGVISYPRFLPPWFREERLVEAWYAVTLAEAFGAPACGVLFNAVKAEQVAGASAVVRPTLGPAMTPRIAGRDALQTQPGVGLTPTLAWSEPALGTATHYILNTYERGACSSSRQRFSVMTTSTTFTIPPGVLEAGHVYYASISPVSEPNRDPAAPLQLTLPAEVAVTLTAAFTP